MRNQSLGDAYAKYLRTWGPIRWDFSTQLQMPYSQSRLRTLRALGAIEVDSRTMYQKLKIAGVDRDPIIAEFAVRWLAEEAEHGRALNALADLYGNAEMLDPRTRKPNLRQLSAWPILAIARPLHSYMTAAYCTLGAVQEYIALTTYAYLGGELADYAGGSLLKDMSVQEARHMRFYLAAAEAMLHRRSTQRFVRAVLSCFWKPVGFDSIGAAAWWSAFGPLLESEEFRARLLKMDQVVDSLPGLQSLDLMRHFIASQKRSVETPLDLEVTG